MTSLVESKPETLKREDSARSTSLGFVFGIAAGSLAAFLYATPAGKKVRTKLEDDGKELMESLQKADYSMAAQNSIVVMMKRAYDWLLAYSKRIE